MKLRILAFTALTTIFTATPVKAETIVNFGVSLDGDGPGISIITSPRRYRVHRSRYQYDQFDRSDYRLYNPRYRYGWYDYPRYRGYHQRYRYGRGYYPRRSGLQIRIGF